MNQHRAYYPLDDAPAEEGDRLFLGVNARLKPAMLGAGEVADAVNMRFDSGAAEPRRGLMIHPWGAEGASNYDPGLIVPYGAVVTAATYRDPIERTEWIIVATEHGSFRCRPGSSGMSIAGPVGMQVPVASKLIQTYSGMILLRGAGLEPLYLRDLDEGWLALPAATGDGLEAVPRATDGVFWQNRLFLVDARADAVHSDSVWVSDVGAINTVLQGETLYQAFKINQGSADRLTAIYPFNATTLVAAKERSVYVVSDVYGDNERIAQLARLDQVTGEWGCRAPKSLVQVGKDVWLLAHRRGVCSLRLTETNSIQGLDLPISRDIQPIVDRINWDQADGATAAAHDNRVYFAVPIDGATYNNALLIYSTLTQRWAGYDSSAAVKVRDFIKFGYGGTVRLGYVSTDGFLYEIGVGLYDETADSEGVVTRHEIAWRCKSRGYGGGTPGTKRFSALRAKVATFNPAYAVTVAVQGVARSRTLPSRGKTRTQWHRPYGRAAWDPTNANDDFLDPNRQDYSWPISATGMELGAGIKVDLHQETEDAWRLRERGQFLQVEFTGTAGRCVIRELSVAIQRGQTRKGTLA